MTGNEQRVLGVLFGQPDRSFYASELIRTAGTGSGAAQRELAKLESSGLIVGRRIGHQKHYQANRACTAFHELHGLVVKTLTGRRVVPRRSEPPELPTPRSRREIPASVPPPAPDDGWKSW